MEIVLVLIGLAAVGLVVLAAIPGVLTLVSRSRRRAIDRAAPELRSEARVVDKRTRVTGGGREPTEQRYYVTFQFPDGQRTELQILGADAGILVIGDAGVLHWRGTRFLGFARTILR